MRLCPWPWPRAFLSLASSGSVLGKAVLGLGFFLCPWPWPCVFDSTSGGNVHPNPGPISNHPRPRYPCSICHLDVGRDSLQCSACLKWMHFFCSSLTHADFRTICATATAVRWRCPACCPQSQTGSPTQTRSPVMSCASPPPPPPGFPPLPPGFYQLRPPWGPPRYPCSMCSHKVGKDSLKHCLSTFFEIVHTFNFYLKACTPRSLQHNTLKLHQR